MKNFPKKMNIYYKEKMFENYRTIEKENNKRRFKYKTKTLICFLSSERERERA